MAFEKFASDIELAQQKLMTAEEYAGMTHDTPYIFSLEKGDKKLTYFGSPHTNNPSDPVLSDIESKYQSANPDAVLVEGFSNLHGRQGKYKQWAQSCSREDAIHIGENAFVLWLALRDGKEVKSPEPALEDEITYLESLNFSRSEIFVFYVTRYLYQYQRSIDKRSSVEKYVQTELDSLSRTTHWRDFSFTFDHFTALYEEVIGESFNITDGSLESAIDPIPWSSSPKHTRINEVSRASSRYRDMYIIKEVGTMLQSRNNLFVVYGASHAVMEEFAMRTLLGLGSRNPT